MDIEAYFLDVFNSRDLIHDDDMAALMKVSEHEQTMLIEAWKIKGWIHVLHYDQAGGTLRRIYFVKYTEPRIV